MFYVEDMIDHLEWMNFSKVKFQKEHDGDYHFKAFDKMDRDNCQIKINHEGYIYVKYEDEDRWGSSIGKFSS